MNKFYVVFDGEGRYCDVDSQLRDDATYLTAADAEKVKADWNEVEEVNRNEEIECIKAYHEEVLREFFEKWEAGESFTMF